MAVRITPRLRPSVAALPFEFVERKGVGHPDTICDAIAEQASRDYSRYCLAEFGRVPHHWFDKVMLIGGESRLDYGVGELVKPYRIIVAGKAALAVGEREIPLLQLLGEAAAAVLGSVLTGFEPKRHMVLLSEVVDHQGAGRTRSRYRPATIDDLLALDDHERVSNDSNLLTGFAPLTTLEAMVLELERHINGPEYKAARPVTGWDVKILGRRVGDHHHLVVNVPFLAAGVESMDHYREHKALVRADVDEFLTRRFGLEPELLINATDRNGRPYLTALGSVADTGDVGVVGRGNRLNGLITPMRPMSIEAPAGKNPLDHTGKLYAVLAQELADELYAEFQRGVDVFIFTSKQAPLSSPDEVVVEVDDWREDPHESEAARAYVQSRLDSIYMLSREFIEAGRTMW